MAAMWDEWARDIGVQPWPMPQTPDVAERTGTMIVPAYLEQYQKGWIVPGNRFAPFDVLG